MDLLHRIHQSGITRMMDSFCWIHQSGIVDSFYRIHQSDISLKNIEDKKPYRESNKDSECIILSRERTVSMWSGLTGEFIPGKHDISELAEEVLAPLLRVEFQALVSFMSSETRSVSFREIQERFIAFKSCIEKVFLSITSQMLYLLSKSKDSELSKDCDETEDVDEIEQRSLNMLTDTPMRKTAESNTLFVDDYQVEYLNEKPSVVAEGKDQQTGARSDDEFEENPLAKPIPESRARPGKKSSVKADIGVNGGDMELLGFQVHFPKNAVKRKMEFELSLDSNRKNFPTDKGVPIAPILEVKPSIKFDEPVTVKIVTWYSAAQGEHQIVDVLTQEENEEHWTADQKITLSDKNQVTFKVWHFCKKLATVNKESSVDGLFYFKNRVYIQKRTGAILSAFLRDGLDTNDSHSELLGSNHHLMSHSQKIFGKLNSVFKLSLTCTKPDSIGYLAEPDPPQFKISTDLLDQDVHSITFFDPNFPQDYRGTIILRYIITPPSNTHCQIQSRALTCWWPVETPNTGNTVKVTQEVTQDYSTNAVTMVRDQAKMMSTEIKTEKTLTKR